MPYEYETSVFGGEPVLVTDWGVSGYDPPIGYPDTPSVIVQTPRVDTGSNDWFGFLDKLAETVQRGAEIALAYKAADARYTAYPGTGQNIAKAGQRTEPFQISAGTVALIGAALVGLWLVTQAAK